MGFRFRKSIKLIPGIRLNLGKRGASVSVGGRGFTTNISGKGVRETVSLPGTGLSYSTYQKHATRPQIGSGGTTSLGAKIVAVALLVFVLIAVIVGLTS